MTAIGEAVNAFRSLDSTVDGVDVWSLDSVGLQKLADGVRDGQAALDRLLIRIGVAADAHDAEGRGRGAHATMLGDGSRVRGRTARRDVDRARTAAAMPGVRDAIESGRIGATQVDAITYATRTLTPEQITQLDTPSLIDAAEALPADLFARRVRDEAEHLKGDHGLADTRAHQARSSWKHWTDNKTGMGRISAEFDPERYEAIVNAIEAQLGRLANQGGVSKTQNLAAQAAYELLAGKAHRSSGLPLINVVVDANTMASGLHHQSIRETATGQPLPPESIARLACDAVLQRVTLDHRSIPIDVGRKHRTATDAQWAALRSRYRTCAWKSCDRPLTWCQAHHIHEWEHEGATDLCNLIPLCNQHHHAVHEGGWTVKLSPTRQLHIYDPDKIHWGTAEPDRTPGVSPAKPEGP